MEIVLIRHGEPEWSRDGYAVGNPPLTARGLRQAERLADVLSGEHFDEILVSPLQRARQTAAPLLAALGRDEIVADWLKEIGDPSWHGTPQAIAAEAYKELSSRASDDRWHGLDGGETVREFAARIAQGTDEFLADRGVLRTEAELPVWKIAEPGLRVALVAHAGTNSMAIGHLLGVPPVPWQWERFVLMHTSITRITAHELGDGHTFGLTKLSDVEHLDPDERTR